VEDKTHLYKTTLMAFASEGYSLLYAKDGLEALDAYRKHHKDIELVLTVMNLPILGGEKLTTAMLEINPKLKIVF
jgi:CheY-like chemotaxis protein